jgi:hypothetical protein
MPFRTCGSTIWRPTMRVTSSALPIASVVPM